jgi:hypothetical protein
MGQGMSFGQDQLNEVYLSYYHNNYSKFNAAQIGHHNKQAAMIRYSGFSGVKRVLNNVFINTYTSSKNEKLVYGLNFNNEQEGKFIARMNTDFMLNYFIFKKGDQRLSASLSSGAYNLYYKSDGLTPGGSAWTGDISFSSFFSADDYRFGLALNHLVFGELTPIDATSTKSVHLNMIGSRSFDLVKDMEYVLTVMGDLNLVGGSVVDVYQELKTRNYLFGVSMLNLNTFGFVGGLDEIVLRDFKCSLDFVYNVKFRSFDRFIAHKYEIGLRYYLE